MSELQVNHSSAEEYEVFHIEDHDDGFGKHRPKPDREKCAAQDQVSFCVPLSFDQELTMGTGGTGPTLVPLSTVATNIGGLRGTLKLKFNNNLSKAAYALLVFGANGPNNRIVAAHLHLGSAGANGPVIVPLFNGPARNVDGLLVKGTIDNRSITNTDILGLITVNSVASLYQAIRSGLVYTNVHSERFPNGVIRGQIFFRTGI